MLDCFADIDICLCGCHRDPGVMHIVECCWRCENCGQRIVTWRYEEHKTRCPSPSRLAAALPVFPPIRHHTHQSGIFY
jgi:hypothetical protein